MSKLTHEQEKLEYGLDKEKELYLVNIYTEYHTPKYMYDRRTLNLTFETEDDLKFQRLYVKKNAKTVKHIYPNNFYDKLNNRIEVAKQSNIRRLLYQRYNLQNKEAGK